MSIFSKEKRIIAIKQLGDYLLNGDDELQNLVESAKHKNAWFTKDEVGKAVLANGQMLNQYDLNNWLSGYHLNFERPKKVGLILAGNLPLVGFHDVLAVLLTGNIALIKLSSQDDNLIPFLLKKLTEIEPAFENQIVFVQKLEDFDAVIATGSNNSSRYFDYYFAKVPNIIRKNRNSIALLTGDESKEELHLLGNDIFDYYGLGCRNVSKLLVPKDYNFIPFFEAIEPFNEILNHHKYQNNYDYNKSIYLINKNKHFDNGFLLVTESDKITSPLSAVFYQEYGSLEEAINYINTEKDNIQVVVSNSDVELPTAKVKLGESQSPKLWDYADGVDTIAFLTALV
ncbi:acyl-CoA reductase [Pedobacter arcticus]|uniref:acyl-CoA reductase n=1 Tax=Pedobacter arcticus TaxID=752140 RepID=UPI000312A639|nr:acyl-CoA reductase [Pedobacter arcticus]